MLFRMTIAMLLVSRSCGLLSGFSRALGHGTTVFRRNLAVKAQRGRGSGSKRGGLSHPPRASHRKQRQRQQQQQQPGGSLESIGEKGGGLCTGEGHDQFRSDVRDFRKANSARKLVNYLEASSEEGTLTQAMAVYGYRTLQRMDRGDLLPDVVALWLGAGQSFIDKRAFADEWEGMGASFSDVLDQDVDSLSVDLRPATLLIRAACRLQRMDLAEQMAQHMGVHIESPPTSSGGREKGEDTDTLAATAALVRGFPVSQYANQNRRVLEYVRCHEASLVLLPELVLGYAINGAHRKATRGLEALAARMDTVSRALPKELGLQISHSDGEAGGTGSLTGLALDGTRVRLILKAFTQNGRHDDIRRALPALLRVNGRSGLRQENKRSEQDNDLLQLLCNTYLQDLHFVKGAVSMSTLPKDVRPEVAFIGRSNVGKSSLINMLTNRKGLAYTSKTPGKTSEFNYFDASARVGVDKEPFSFYLVDIPGVGFARKDQQTRAGWVRLLRDFTSARSSLTTVFHLVDSRHGIMEADNECFTLLESLPPTCQYCVVLTKADKRGGAGRTQMVDKIRHELSERMAANPEYRNLDGSAIAVPIVLTSAETRQGAAELWSVMLDSLSGERPAGFIQ